jgi:ketosteroid isomerase-like protein
VGQARGSTSDSAAKVALVREGHERFNRGDIDGCLELLTEDLEWHPAFGAALIGISVYRGHGGFRRYFEQVNEVIAGFTVAPGEVAVAGDYVVLDANVSGRGRGSGMDVSTRLTIVWKVRESRLCWGGTYFNRGEALEAVALTEDELQPVAEASS